jgi:hypothetical protein
MQHEHLRSVAGKAVGSEKEAPHAVVRLNMGIYSINATTYANPLTVSQDDA